METLTPIINANRIHAQADLEAAAGELRRKWALGEGPISNLMELLEGEGVRIYEIESGKKFHGISAMRERSRSSL